MCLIPGVDQRAAALIGAALVAAPLSCGGAERGPRVPAYGHATPVYGGTFLFADEDDFRTLDPAIAYDEVSWSAERLIFNTLLRYDDDVRIEGDLATRWEISDDGLVWTFHLRDDVFFHHGRRMVADDVVASWTRLLDPKLASPGADFYDVILGADDVLAGTADTVAGLSAPDPTTLVVTLKIPDPTFGDVVAMFFGAVVPIEVVTERGEKWAHAPVGTGPFELTEWNIGEKAVFSRYDAYHEDGLPYLDRVVHLANYPRAVQFMKLEANELHQLNRLTSPDYLWARDTPGWAAQLQEIPAIDTYGELMNNEIPPFDNVWFRRAVSTAISRDKLHKLRNGRLRRTVSWVPPALNGFADWETMSAEDREYFKYQRYDPELSRACLEKAGFPNGYPEPIPYWTINSEGSLVTSLSIQQDLAAVGIQIDLKTTTTSTYFTATGRRGEVAMAYTAWVMDYPDQRNFLESRLHCDSIAEENSTNDSFYCNPEVDAFLDAAAVATDPEERKRLYWSAHRIIASEAPYAFEYHSTSLSIAQPYVRDFHVHPVYTRDMSRAWLDLPDGRPAP